MIYFDNAATTQMSDLALSTLINLSKMNYGNASAIYGFGRKAKEMLEEARSIIAESIGAFADEIFFTSGGTESDNWAVSQAKTFAKRIITSSIEHHAILNPIKLLEKSGYDIKILPVDSGCNISLNKLEQVLDDRRSFVSVMMQNNETGVRQDISSFAEIVHKYNSKSIFHTDAVQAVGHRKINVHELGVDMLSASAHKFNGPKGVGFLYISRNIKPTSFIYGGGQESGLRSGTENVAGVYSMAKALEENMSQIEYIDKHIQNLENLFFRTMSDSGIHYELNGTMKNKAVGIINISIDGVDGEGLLNMLDMHDICVSVGSACNSKSKEHSHVLTAMGIDENRIESSIRISMGRFNSEEEVKELVFWIKKFYQLSLNTTI